MSELGPLSHNEVINELHTIMNEKYWESSLFEAIYNIVKYAGVRNDRELLEQLESLKILSAQDADLNKKIGNLLQKWQPQVASTPTNAEISQTSALEKNDQIESKNISSLIPQSPKNMADQLKSYNASLFAKITEADFEQDDISKTSSFRAIQEAQAQIRHKVQDDILLAKSKAQQKSIASFYVKVVQESLNSGDHFSAYVIAGALKALNADLSSTKLIKDEQLAVLSSGVLNDLLGSSVNGVGDYTAKLQKGEFNQPGTLPIIAGLEAKMAQAYEGYTVASFKISNAKKAEENIKNGKGITDPETKEFMRLAGIVTAKKSEEEIITAISNTAAKTKEDARKERDDKVKNDKALIQNVKKESENVNKVEFSVLEQQLKSSKMSALSAYNIYALLRVSSKNDLDVMMKNEAVQKNTVVLIQTSDEHGKPNGFNVKICDEAGKLIDGPKLFTFDVPKTEIVDGIEKPLPAGVIKSKQADADKLKSSFEELIPNQRVFSNTPAKEEFMAKVSANSLLSPSQLIIKKLNENKGKISKEISELQAPYQNSEFEVEREKKSKIKRRLGMSKEKTNYRSAIKSEFRKILDVARDRRKSTANHDKVSEEKAQAQQPQQAVVTPSSEATAKSTQPTTQSTPQPVPQTVTPPTAQAATPSKPQAPVQSTTVAPPVSQSATLQVLGKDTVPESKPTVIAQMMSGH